MKQPIVITTAITGSQPRKRDNPALPVTPAEQIESTHEAFEAGSSLVHIHVRDKHENSSSDPELFGQVQEGVRKHCPGMIIQFSTGGRGREADQRGAMMHLKPDMASLATGSAEHIYDTLYCARGQAENLIKRHKSQLASDRTSCRSANANQMRLILHTAAYWLLWRIQQAMPRTAALASAEFTTLRLRLLKVAARVVESASRIRIAFASACPDADLFRALVSFGFVVVAPRACANGCDDDRASLPRDPPGFAHCEFD